MTKVVITGAAGNIGTKLRRHFESLGWELSLLDAKESSDKAIRVADLAVWSDEWVAEFRDADAVIHLAGNPSPKTSWESAQHLNLDLTMNVYEAAVRQSARRLVFASSNWVVAGHRFDDWTLTTNVAPYPVNPYGVSKLVGERLGRSYSDRWGLSVLCFRIGYCQRGDNQPGTHMGWGVWGQRMWLSDRDLCQGFEKAVRAPADLRFAVLNLMSRNEGMRWDLDAARDAIGYEPIDRFMPTESDAMREQTASARHARRLVETAEGFIQEQRW
jgi:NAD+ dependent glucose-6-phosphate dehydrogenase